MQNKQQKEIKNPLKVFITGGAGFIGSAVAECLSCEGWPVMVYDNFSSGSRQNLNHCQEEYLEIIEGDILDVGKLTSSLKAFRPDIVLHLAAVHYIPQCEADPTTTNRINVTGTLNLIKGILQFTEPSPRLIFASSASVYAATNSGKKSETSRLDPGDVYGISKLLGERAIKDALKTYNIIRIFNVYGPRDNNPHLIPSVLKQTQTGNDVYLGSSMPRRDFIYVTDVAQAILTILERGKSKQTYNIGTGICYSVEEITKALVRALKLTNVRFHFGCVERMRKQDSLVVRADIDKIRRDTGWSPQVSLKKGLKNTLDYYRSFPGQGSIINPSL